jgi:hypothetical protein
MRGYEGYAALGDMLAGGAQPDGMAYAEGAYAGNRAKREGFNADEAFEKARIARMMAEARSSLPDAMVGAGFDPKLTPYLGALLQGNQTMNAGQLGMLELPQAGAAFAGAEDAVLAGKLGEANALTQFAQGKVYDPYEAVGGGKAVLRADTGDLALTGLGEASVGAEAALAGAREASADASRARAETTRNPPPKAAPADKARDTALTQAAKGADRAKVVARLAELGYADAEGEL